ncbi:MAG: hypothetical protein RSP_11450 [Rhodanobacter sp.]
MPILETAAAIAGAGGEAASKVVVKATATKLAREFNDRVIGPFFEKRRAQAALIDGVRRYMRSCEKKTRYVPTIAIQGSKFLLDEVYEPLVLIRTEDRQEFEVSGFPHEVFNANTCVLVTDSAGMGKSTLSKFLLRRCLDELSRIPVLIELRRVKEGQTVESFICDEMVGANGTEGCRRKLMESFSKGGFIFILDGYDEIDESIRQSVSLDVFRMSREYADCAFWLTSRPDSGLASFTGFLEYKIKPLCLDQAHSLLRRYDSGRGKAEPLIAKMKGLTQIEGFLGNPLLVTLLYKAYDYKATVPLKRNIFFRQVYDALYQDHDLSKEGAFERRKKSSLDSDDFHKALRALGIVTFKNGKVQYGVEEFAGLLTEAAGLISPIRLEVGKWKSDLLSAVPIFMKDGHDIRWSHKAFQDYFAAQFAFFDMGVRCEEFVRRLLSDDNPLKNENVLTMLAELDIEVLRSGFVRSYAAELVARAEKLGMAGNELDFATFSARECGEFFILTTDYPEEKMLSGFEKFPDFLSLARERLGREIAFKQATLTRFEKNAILGVFSDAFFPRHQLIARLDQRAFMRPDFFGKFDRKKDLDVIEGLASDGWFSVNDALLAVRDDSDKESLLRMVGRCIHWGIPSLVSVRSILGDDQGKKRAANIDDLLSGLGAN